MNRAHERFNELEKLMNSKNIDIDRIRDKVGFLQGQCAFASSILNGIQPIFRSARRKNKQIRISEIVKKVMRYYEIQMEKIGVKVEILESGPPLVIKSSEGVLLQLFINLFDNSIYWLNSNEIGSPKITINIDGNKYKVIFSDNGPGIKKSDLDYIFEPFFTTKGISGRGLGLYIARQLTDRYYYELYYITKQSDMKLTGANFAIEFTE